MHNFLFVILFSFDSKNVLLTWMILNYFSFRSIWLCNLPLAHWLLLLSWFQNWSVTPLRSILLIIEWKVSIFYIWWGSYKTRVHQFELLLLLYYFKMWPWWLFGSHILTHIQSISRVGMDSHLLLHYGRTALLEVISGLWLLRRWQLSWTLWIVCVIWAHRWDVIILLLLRPMRSQSYRPETELSFFILSRQVGRTEFIAPIIDWFFLIKSLTEIFGVYIIITELFFNFFDQVKDEVTRIFIFDTAHLLFIN